ncbi:MFS transporter [Arachidicoccus terrestris]|uniref:MFS transporter n=1 Tax=Arachidicoccus terrestris TaxID=2875539 RepID=UPI001CC6C97F|nr:MFS transporter [Arachidicoccus terrestris]UAY56434.1 MFS transporter [Arachidicoccus terrestris]
MLKKITDSVRKYFLEQKALTHKNYRLFMVGQSFSLIGTWIQRMAMIWLSYQLTGSAFLLGLVGFCEQIPIFILAPFAGVYADKWDKHKALCRIEAFAMIQALILGILTLTGTVNIYHIIVLSLCLGCINAFEVPMRQSFVVDMVDREKEVLPNAIALNSTVFNLSRLIGPSIAGILISSVGEGWCFMANALSYAIVLVSLLLMNIKKLPPVAATSAKVLTRLKEGIQYIKRKQIMRTLLLLLAIVSFSNASLRTLAPIFAQDVLHGDANTLGFLMSASGVGAICGALFLTKSKTTPLLQKIVSMTGILLGTGMILFAISKSLILSLIFIGIAGLAQMMHTACTNTLLQLHVADDKRGRVMSFYTVCLQGTMPFGSLVAGAIAGALSGPWAMAIMGLICLAATLIFRHEKHPEQPEDRQLSPA